jgi:hypothetical protein
VCLVTTVGEKGKSRGGSNFFSGFVLEIDDELSGGLALALGDAPLEPRPKVFPPLRGSGQRILADVSHLIAPPSYPVSVFIAMQDSTASLTAQSCLNPSSPNAACRSTG